MTEACEKRTERTRQLNDRFREDPKDGKIVVTEGVAVIAYNIGLGEILEAVKTFDRFDEANDPHSEHDFGAIEFDGAKVFWKIDYYDRAIQAGSADPSDAKQTTRVMTIMTAEEY
ncbi:DUF3768 domain-containing protein [Henriciella barbarensis]|uniref:DUF3768 domain-containing protein n=1 Tax=Henriciella barbarensis TaxID=86342 RepID=A0A399QV52_9PROT|nr:DUF3768 domain-containing protein [Henriciella barbarensis]RIJ22075.1 DUF3768 domain-containing protein [Henriciella barbarensis]